MKLTCISEADYAMYFTEKRWGNSPIPCANFLKNILREHDVPTNKAFAYQIIMNQNYNDYKDMCMT